MVSPCHQAVHPHWQSFSVCQEAVQQMLHIKDHNIYRSICAFVADFACDTAVLCPSVAQLTSSNTAFWSTYHLESISGAFH